FGKAAHAGRDFEKGRSAITAMAHFIDEAEKLNDFKKGITINFGSIEGGGPVNIVPELCITHINIRYLKESDLNKIKSSIFKLIKEIEKKGVKIELHELSARGPKPLDKKTIKLFDILQEVGLQLDQKIKLRESGGVSDGNILASMGLPTIDTLGVIGGNIHTSEEYMLLDSLKERVKLTVALLIKLMDEKK
ncbi:MAG TPA: M20/M25/M40 family metallo-hydrolase, partial [Parachlamydiaceae bacterium]|nr:M20/M25/M40 family metallo-hydrolase [Parachlamydiaceae bacterium]